MRAVVWIYRAGRTTKLTSRLAKPGPGGRWYGFTKATQEYDRVLQVEGKKPELSCACISKTGRIPKRLVEGAAKNAAQSFFDAVDRELAGGN